MCFSVRLIERVRYQAVMPIGCMSCGISSVQCTAFPKTSTIEQNHAKNSNSHIVEKSSILALYLTHCRVTCVHQVLENESAQTMEAKAALEEAHKEMDRIRRDLQDQMRSMQVRTQHEHV